MRQSQRCQTVPDIYIWGDSDKIYNKDVICENCVKKQDFTLTNQIIQHIIIKNLTEQSDKSYEQK